MGAFSNGTPSPPVPGLPDIPIPNFEQQGKAWTVGQKLAGAWDDFWAMFWGALLPGVQLFMSILVSGIDTILVPLVDLYTALQGNRTPGMYSLVAGVIEDLLGVPVSADSIKSAFAKGGDMGAVRKIGATLYNQLAAEFASGTTLTPQGGVSAAQAFLGFLMAFAIREGNVSFIMSLIPEEYRYGEGIREYGELMARNLGLGRMARRALQPLIQTTIADPLQWALNQQYQPKLLGPDVATRMYNRDVINNGEWYQEMSYAGYTPKRSEALQNEYLSHLNATQIESLRILQAMNSDDAVRALRTANYDLDSANKLLAIFDWNAAKPFYDQRLAVLRQQRLSGDMNAPTFDQQVNSLNIGVAAQSAFKDTVAQELLFPRAHLTLAQMETAYTEGMIDLDQLGAYLQKAGYSQDDATVLTMLTLLKLDTLEAKQAVAKYKYDIAVAKAAAKGEAPPPPPAILAT